jgi:hypothetical protein
MTRITLAVFATLAATACTSTQYYVADADTPVASPELATVNPDTPIPGAKALPTGVSQQKTYNSDNRPIVTRSGLNSDPNNPNGTPASPRHWYEI